MTTDTIQDDLAFIKKIVEESRKNVGLSGDHLIVWGLLVSIGLMVTWANHYFQWHASEWLHWILVIGGGWLFEIIYGRTVDRKKPVLTYAEKIDGFLWLSIGITMTLLGFIGIGTHGIHPHVISPIFSTILAIGYFSSGVIYDVKWIRNLAFGWWGGAIIMFIFPGLYHLLFMAAMMVVLQTIPGFIIKKTWGEKYGVN